MAKKSKDDPLFWVIMALLCIPFAGLFILWFFLKGIVWILGLLAGVSNTPKTKTKSTASSKPKKPKQTYTAQSKTKKVSLYEALRLPGDPDPEPNGCIIPVTDDFYDTEDDYDNYDNYDGIDDTDDLAGALVLQNMWHEREYADEENADGYEDDPDYSWETHCEYCGELLEDCECDYKHESHEAIGLDYCDCDDEDDGWNEGSRDDDRNGLLDFDEFNSF